MVLLVLGGAGWLTTRDGGNAAGVGGEPPRTAQAVRTDLEEETVFRWPDGSQLGGYSPWFTLEPNSRNAGNLTQNCVFMNGQGDWFDLRCEPDGVVPVRSWCCDVP